MVNNIIKKDDALEREKRRLAALGPTSAQRWQGNSYLLNMQSRIDTVTLGDCVPLIVGELPPNY